MKNLTNVSPFLLLLFPVFIMLLFTLSTVAGQTEPSDIVSQKAKTPATAIVKFATQILR